MATGGGRECLAGIHQIERARSTRLRCADRQNRVAVAVGEIGKAEAGAEARIAEGVPGIGAVEAGAPIDGLVHGLVADRVAPFLPLQLQITAAVEQIDRSHGGALDRLIVALGGRHNRVHLQSLEVLHRWAGGVAAELHVVDADAVLQGEGASPRQLNLFQRPSVGGAGGSVARSQLLLHRFAAAIEQGGLHAGGRHGDAAAAVDVDVIDGDGAAEAAAPVGADGGAGGVGADRDATAAHRCTGERRGQVLVPAARIGGRVGIAVDGADRLQ